MNQERRKKLEKISSDLSALSTELESIKDEEVEADEAKPEHLQDSSAGDALDEAVASLGEAESKIDEALGG